MYDVTVDGYNIGIIKMDEQSVAELRELGFIITRIDK